MKPTETPKVLLQWYAPKRKTKATVRAAAQTATYSVQFGQGPGASGRNANWVISERRAVGDNIDF